MPRGTVTTVRVEERSAAALFDPEPAPALPATGRRLRAEFARYLERSVRVEPRAPSVTVEVGLEGPPLGPSEEARVADDLRSHFRFEVRLADLDLRVNRVEGRAAFRFFAPLVLFALAAAGLLYVELPRLEPTGLAEFVTALVYLVFITVVWVLLWDPTELLLFDAYFLRARRAALAKLATATVRFEYGTPGRPA